jgi:hypothetical protein
MRRVFETAIANADKVSFTIIAVPATSEEFIGIFFGIARNAGNRSGRRSGASNCRSETLSDPWLKRA